MIDADALRRRTDLLAIASRDTKLKKSGGGWWNGPCPFCGGKDRFVLHDTGEGWRWLCRKCGDGKYHNAIDYVMQRDSCGFMDACKTLGAVESMPGNPVRQPDPEPLLEHQPNNQDDWQAAAQKIVQICEDELWSGSNTSRKALEYLKNKRGLSEDTIKKWRLGFSYGDYIGRIYVCGGITVPAFAGGKIWYIKVRLIDGVKYKCQNRNCQKVLDKPGVCPFCGEKNKYKAVPGGRAAMFGAETLRGKSQALLTEGEFDAILADQEFAGGAGVGVFTLGSQSSNLDLVTWGKYLMPLEGIVAVYDSDGSSEQGIQKIRSVSDVMHLATVPRLKPGNKDVTDFVLSGGNLKAWLLAEFGFWGMDIADLVDRRNLADELERGAMDLSTATRDARETGDFDRANNLSACYDRWFELAEGLAK